MAEIIALRAYQLEQIIAAEGSEITTSSTVDDVLRYVRDGKTYGCPNCRKTGIIKTTEICPTCEGDGYTATQKTIDYDNSSIVYKDVSA